MNHHILFVDDEAPIRELLSLFFRKKGFAVSTAITPAEAKELIHRTEFSVAIVDVNLAGESGLDLLKVLRVQRPGLPVIVFTGLTGDEKLVEEAMSAGACGFMRKTDSLMDLYTEVARHLPKASGA